MPVSTNYAEPWNNEDDRDRQFGYRFNHQFHSGWNLYNGFQLSRFNARYLEVYTTGADATDPSRVARLSDALYFPYLYRYSRTNLTGTTRTGAITHHIALGFEAGWVTGSSEGPGGYAPSVSILDPQIGRDFSFAQGVSALADPYFVLSYTTVYHNQAIYAQDQVDLGRHWKAIIGLRGDRYFQDAINTATNSHQTQTDYPVSPRAGVVYQPREWLSLYASYIRAFVPTSPSSVNRDGRQFSPERDQQWEAGIKTQSQSGHLSATVALFRIEENNVLAPDPTNSLFYVQNGQERSKGVEVEFRGSPLIGLNLLTSYAFTQAQVTQSIEYPVGNILPNAPRNSGAVWASYQAPRGLLRNLGLSAGVVATSYRYDNFYQLANPGAFPGQSVSGALLPGYARLDVGTFYDFHAGERQKFRLSANIQNALDRVYYLASNGLDQVRPRFAYSSVGLSPVDTAMMLPTKLYMVACLLVLDIGCSPRVSSRLLVFPEPGPTAAEIRVPQATALPDGRMLLSWQRVLPANAGYGFEMAIKDGSEWSPVRSIASGSDLSMFTADLPAVAPLAGSALLAYWEVKDAREGDRYATTIKTAISHDDGRTWVATVTPYPDALSGQHSLLSWFRTQSGVSLVWLDARARSEVRHALHHTGMEHTHSDLGAVGLRCADLNAQGNVEREQFLQPIACECCPTSAAVTDRGPVVAYRGRREAPGTLPSEVHDSRPTVRDIYLVRQVNGTWQTPVLVHKDKWVINACPDNGPAVDGSGSRVAVAWWTRSQDQPKVQIAFSSNAGATFGPAFRVDAGNGEGQATVALLSGGRSAIVGWLENGRTWARYVNDSGSTSPPIALGPSPAHSRLPRWLRSRDGSVTAAWTSKEAGSTHLEMARIVLKDAD